MAEQAQGRDSASGNLTLSGHPLPHSNLTSTGPPHGGPRWWAWGSSEGHGALPGVARGLALDSAQWSKGPEDMCSWSPGVPSRQDSEAHSPGGRRQKPPWLSRPVRMPSQQAEGVPVGDNAGEPHHQRHLPSHPFSPTILHPSSLTPAIDMGEQGDTSFVPGSVLGAEGKGWGGKTDVVTALKRS